MAVVPPPLLNIYIYILLPILVRAIIFFVLDLQDPFPPSNKKTKNKGKLYIHTHIGVVQDTRYFLVSGKESYNSKGWVVV